MSELAKALKCLLQQVDEDCPQEYRTRHLIDAMEDADSVLKGYYSTGGK